MNPNKEKQKQTKRNPVNNEHNTQICLLHNEAETNAGSIKVQLTINWLLFSLIFRYFKNFL